MNPIIDEIYRSRVVRDSSGREYPLNSSISPVEGDYIHRLITSDISVVTTLEVGCAYGLSSLYICESMRGRPGASHTIIDPKELSDWHGVGVSLLEAAGIDFFRLLTQPSEQALPELARLQPGSFDLIFIDGWHTFDQVLVELFYSNLLLRAGGYIVLDDCDWASVAKAVSYFENYPSYERVQQSTPPRSWRQMVAAIVRAMVPRPLANALPLAIYNRFYLRARYPSLVALRKLSDDGRDWTWFEGF